MKYEARQLLIEAMRAAARRVDDFQPTRFGDVRHITIELMEAAERGNLHPLVSLLTLGIEQQLIRMHPQRETLKLRSAELSETEYPGENRQNVVLSANMPDEMAFRIRRLCERAARVAIVEIPHP